MHFHLAGPKHGWNTVFWDLAIVTVGVLVALAAQQVADDLHWKREAADFRNALKPELSIDLGTYGFRASESACLNKRLDDLQVWLDRSRAHRPFNLIGPIGIPDSLVVNNNVWQSRDATVVAHMTLQEKLEYAHLYNEFANNEVHRLDERAAWIELAEYDGATELDHQDLMRLQGLITRARLRDMRMNDNAARFTRRAAEMGILPKADPNWPKPKTQLCGPILPAEVAGQRKRTG